ncbi:MAG: quinol dehydrogenase ferredoxin subunit NapH [Gammaproteobacteria bacterium]|nr:quinol dehydrogenase ferredoxin subunit NapH [Gammaproteobacteria bacterium]
MNTPTPDIQQNDSLERSWLQRHKWLLLRRLTQLLVFSLFLIGPLAGIWIIKGNLSSSLTLDILPLSDPFIAVQSLFAGQYLSTVIITGAIIVSLFYLLVGGRVYCSWLCPINIATDSASWLRKKLNIKSSSLFPRNTRYWLLTVTFVMALITGTLSWELINPVSLVQRGIINGLLISGLILLVIFLFDLLISRDAWCGHICPVGAFYSLFGRMGVIRISAYQRNKCDNCMDCFLVCPEEQVIHPALHGEKHNASPLILNLNCTNCGRCIDVCDKQVFKFTSRFNHSTISNEYQNQESSQ